MFLNAFGKPPTLVFHACALNSKLAPTAPCSFGSAEKQQKRTEVEQKYEQLQHSKAEPKASEEKEDEKQEEEEVVYEKAPKKKVKRKVVVVQESSDEEEIEVRLPKKKNIKAAEPDINPFLMNRVFAHPGRYG